MRTALKLLTLLSFMLFVSDAQERFVDADSLNLAHISLQEQYCKSIKPTQKLCKSKKLSYIDYDDTKLPTFLKGIKQHIEPVVLAYKADDLKKSTLSDLKEFSGDISGEWEDESSIELFAKTATTYTLSTSSSGYSGGAHGYHGMQFDNYNIQTGAKLTLDDLFVADYNQTLHAIAKEHYKASMGLKAQQPLTDDNWFDDNFVLASAFAITANGLYFFYNSYEIKPYAAGNTEFMLPYSKLKSIINPKGVLGFALEDNKTSHTLFKQDEALSLDISAQPQPDGTVQITASMQNLSYENKGWLSLSFPQLTAKEAIKNIQTQGFKSVQAYPKGSNIYNNEHKKAVKSAYLLVEGEDTQWQYNDTHSITLSVVPPSTDKELILDIRGNFKSKEKSIMLPKEYEGIKGQQGFTNYRVFIAL